MGGNGEIEGDSRKGVKDMGVASNLILWVVVITAESAKYAEF